MSEVAQRTIIGPLLFLFYINNLTLPASSPSVLLFADDTKCMKSISKISDIQQLKSDHMALSDWSIRWNLPFSSSQLLVSLMGILSNSSSNSLIVSTQKGSPKQL